MISGVCLLRLRAISKIDGAQLTQCDQSRLWCDCEIWSSHGRTWLTAVSKVIAGHFRKRL